MGQLKPKKEKKADGKKIEVEQTEVLGFSEHALPSDKELKNEEIEESLKEIYQDEDGKLANVSTFDIKKRHGFIFYIVSTAVSMGFVAGAVWGFLKFVYLPKTATSGVELAIDAPKEIASGQEFSYVVTYKNLNSVDIKNIEISLAYPNNFVFEGSDIATSTDNGWKIESLGSHRSGRIEIKGKIIGQKDEVDNVYASMTYMPANFSSEFKKEASFASTINNLGIDFTFDHDNSVLMNEDTQISVKYDVKTGDNYLDSFQLSIPNVDGIAFAASTSISTSTEKIENVKPGVWKISNLQDQGELDIKLRFTDKSADTQNLPVVFEYMVGDKPYKFLEQDLPYEIIRNDLNLNMILNGSRDDQAIDFGKTLNYSVVYANKGGEEMKDVVIMAVLDSKILDWQSLRDANNGKASGNTITWTKNEIPALASLQNGNEGTIDFSINVLPLNKAKNKVDDNKYEVQSFAQFNIGNKETQSDNTKSNVINSRVNSDLSLKEQVLYFNADNIAVGSGPIPPKVGETTSYKVYWTLDNNLHELGSLQVQTTLPKGVTWDSKNRTTVGSIQYDDSSRTITWDVGRLPLDVNELSAEFNIKITPSEDDRGRIMVLLSGTKVHAIDTVTNAALDQVGGAKTTKLEDDDIANNEGGLIR